MTKLYDFIVTVGHEMEYGRYVNVKAENLKQAIKLGYAQADKEKKEYVFQVKWNVPKWFLEALGDPCNQTIYDPINGDRKTGKTSWYDRNRPLRTPEAMEKLRAKLLKLHEQQLSIYGMDALRTLLATFKGKKKQLDEHEAFFNKTHLSGNLWDDLVAAFGDTGGYRNSIALEAMRTAAKPLSQVLERAYYKSVYYNSWKDREIQIVIKKKDYNPSEL